MRKFTLLLILLSVLSCRADYEKAYQLYQQAISRLERMDTVEAAILYRKAYEEDLLIIRLKDYGLSEHMLKLMQQDANEYEMGRALIHFGHPEKAKHYLELVKSNYDDETAEYIWASNHLASINGTGQVITRNDGTQVNARKVLYSEQEGNNAGDPAKNDDADTENAQTGKDMSAFLKKQELTRKRISIKNKIPDLEQKHEEQKKAWEEMDKEHKKFFDLHYGGVGNYLSLEQFYKEKSDAEKVKLDEIQQQIDSLNSELDGIESLIDSFD